MSFLEKCLSRPVVFREKKNLVCIGDFPCLTKYLINKAERNLFFVVDKKNVLCVEMCCRITEKSKQMNNERHYF